MPQLSLYLFGPPRLELDGRPVDISRRNVLALAAYLAITRRPHSREALATMFWPEYEASKAKAALRRTLSALNTALDGDWLDADRETIGFDSERDIWVDVRQFEWCLGEARNGAGTLTRLTEAVALYHDDFLAGFSLRASPAFDEWQFFQSEALRRELAQALERLVAGHRQSNVQAAFPYAQRRVEIDPLDEAAQRDLMRLYVQAGQRTAAVRQYRLLTEALQAELGASPAPETVELFRQLQTAAEPIPFEPPAFLTDDFQPARPPALFVAREREMTQLDGYLAQALDGQGQVVFITGQAGSGKTALVQAFARQAQAAVPDLLVAPGSCDAYLGLGDPYLPFREILQLLAGDVEPRWTRGDITRENARRVWNFLSQSIQTLKTVGPGLIDRLISQNILPEPAHRALAELTPWETPDRSANPPTDGQPSHNDLCEQVAHFLSELAQQRPLLLIIDDAQWIDAASINLLFSLSRRLSTGRILLLVTYRPDDVALGRAGDRHPLAPVINEIQRHYGHPPLDLAQTMTYDFIEALLNAVPNQLGPAFRAALYRRTQGHPLFTVELLRSLQARGDLVKNGQGIWVESDAIDWASLPARVEAVIEERLGRLDDRLRTILATAAVEGETFTVQVVAQVQNMSEGELLRILSQELVQRHQLILEQGEEKVGSMYLARFHFRHALFQQYLYRTLGSSERRWLHGQVAAVLEQTYRDNLEPITVQLARHYAEAGAVEQAVAYLLQAGDKARLLYAHQEAIGFYQQALQFLKAQGGFERAARILLKLGLTHHLAFNFQQSRQAYLDGFALWQQASFPQTPPAPAPHALRTCWVLPPTLDPALFTDDSSGVMIKQLFGRLVSLNPELDVVPELAHSWEILAGGSEYLFRLQDNIRWSDGTPLTAGDFIYGWRRVIDPKLASHNAAHFFDIKGAEAFHAGETSPEQVGIQAVDALTLRIELKNPVSYFPQLLAHPSFSPVPRHAIETYGAAWTEPGHIVTCGPFRLAGQKPSQLITLSRNPDYRGPFTGNLDQVELYLDVEDPEALLARYEADEFDILDLWAFTQRKHIQQRYPGELFSVPKLNVNFLCFNTRQRPFDDPRVRRALAMTLDRELLANIVFAGDRVPATGGFVPPGMPGHTPDLALPFDPEQARRLLAEAGFPEGHNFPPIELAMQPLWSTAVEYLQQIWQEQLNINVRWRKMDFEALLDQVNQDPPSIYNIGWVADYPDPDNLLRVGIQGRWHNPAYFKLVGEAKQRLDHTERLKLYRQADQMLIEEAVVIPLFYSQCHILIKPWVKRFPNSATTQHFWQDVIIEPH
ncbi:MAG: AAA family ATPase [Anaerolineaceae bacterium]|nr:AAA family ATPase [Anaerolineaceae bacterium]MCB9100249.1 AAA family ATPase [Anaerolineales bacterium]